MRFTKAEQALHLAVATDELRHLHDALDEAVLAAYGWPADISDEDLLVRLAELNAERAKEEAEGTIRHLRPSRAGPGKPEVGQPSLPGTAARKAARLPWPSDAMDQLADVLAVIQSAPTPLSLQEIAAHFRRAPRKRLQDILHRLGARRLVVSADSQRYHVLRAA